MSRVSKKPFEKTPDREYRTRRIITIWVLAIVTMQFLAIDIIVVVFPNLKFTESLGLKAILSADGILFGVVLVRIIKYHFPAKS